MSSGSGSGNARRAPTVNGSETGVAAGFSWQTQQQGDPTPPMSYPREKGSPVYGLPLEKEGPSDFFPAVCLKTHWDPTAILRHTLPDGYVPQPLDPRPWTRICMEYTTAGEQSPAPDVDPNIVMPGGGEFYPPNKYSAAIDNESKLRWLDRKLGTCEADQWEPSASSDMYTTRMLIPEHRIPSDSSRIQELAYPRALLRSGPYECRAEDDKYNVSVSSDYIFNNATKQDRYKQMNKPTKPAAPETPLSAVTQRLRPDLVFNAGKPDPTQLVAPVPTNPNPDRSYSAEAANQRADLIANTRGSMGVPKTMLNDMPKALHNQLY